MLAAFALYAQESGIDGESTQELEMDALPQPSVPEPEAQGDLPDENRVFVIADFVFTITGRTQEFALIYNGEFKKGEKIRGEANLKNYVNRKIQVLTNQRVLKDTVEITYSVGEQQPDGTYPVILAIKVEDTANIIVLPMPKFSDNTGFELSLRARDYNFFGTMNPLRANLVYTYDENQRNSFGFEIISSTPFKAFGYNWNIQFDNIFSYTPGVEEPFYFQNVTGLSVEVPFKNTMFTFGFSEAFNLNEENADYLREYYDDLPAFQSGLFMSSKLSASWKIPIGLISNLGEVNYTPNIAAQFNHELPDWPLHDIRRGPFLEFGHSLSLEKIDWHENLRDGLSFEFNNKYSYDIFRLTNEKDMLSVDVTLGATRHFIITEWFGISTRLQYRHWLRSDPAYYYQAGDNIRGIMDKAITADSMLSLNMDFPFRVLRFVPSRWFNSNKLRIFNFELQLSPILDIALFNGTFDEEKSIFNPKDVAIGGGLEFLVYPEFMRSVYVRLSFACNVRELITARPLGLPSGDNREITIVMGHFF